MILSRNAGDLRRRDLGEGPCAELRQNPPEKSLGFSGRAGSIFDFEVVGDEEVEGVREAEALRLVLAEGDLRPDLARALSGGGERNCRVLPDGNPATACAMPEDKRLRSALRDAEREPVLVDVVFLPFFGRAYSPDRRVI
jgi:hypothetical protein